MRADILRWRTKRLSLLELGWSHQSPVTVNSTGPMTCPHRMEGAQTRVMRTTRLQFTVSPRSIVVFVHSPRVHQSLLKEE